MHGDTPRSDADERLVREVIGPTRGSTPDTTVSGAVHAEQSARKATYAAEMKRSPPVGV